MQPVLTITLNPALDVTTSVEKMTPRGKLRCEAPRYDPAGGGINVSRAIKELGGESRAFVALAGTMGQRLHRMLDKAGIDSETWDLHGETRMSLNVWDKSVVQQYRFILPGPEQTAETGEAVLAALTHYIHFGGYRFVVASGSLPPGFPDDFYGEFVRRTRGMDVKVILDTSGPPLKAALSASPFLIKPDTQEARYLLESEDVTPDSAEKLALDLSDKWGPEVVIVTVGSEGAIVVTPDKRLRIRPPKVEMRSTVGAGDSFIAAVTFALANDWSLEDACRYGVAAAASAVTTEATELCRRADTDRYFEEMSGKADILDRNEGRQRVE
jgi:6-phosphofructokinase 2